MCSAERFYREGKLPKRICHCDTKVSNMLFDENGKVLCVIDLDTVMPSFIFSDFGDFLRSAANTGKEDEADLNKVKFNMEIFKAFTKGYIESARTFLTPLEIEMLPYAATLFPYMQAVHMAVEKNSLNTVYFVGTGMDENTHQFCDVLQKELQASGIEVIVAENILYNAENLKKLEKAKGAVLIETIGKTMYTETQQ